MRYQYTSPGFRGPAYLTPKGVKFLLFTNIIVFVLVELSGVQYELFFTNFGLVPAKLWNQFMLWQPVSYLFLHGGIIHLLFNMFVLWMFGKDLEQTWGYKNFLKYYFTCGIGAGIITSLLSWGSFIPVIGASGAIYGLLLAYGLLYPNRLVYLYGLFPIKVKFMIIGLGVMAFFASMTSANSTVSHITHLSGMVVGFIFLQYRLSFSKLKYWFTKQQLKSHQKKTFKQDTQDAEFRREVDKILEKMNDNGWDSLTEDEQKILYKASQKYNQRPN